MPPQRAETTCQRNFREDSGPVDGKGIGAQYCFEESHCANGFRKSSKTTDLDSPASREEGTSADGREAAVVVVVIRVLVGPFGTAQAGAAESARAGAEKGLGAVLRAEAGTGVGAGSVDISLEEVGEGAEEGTGVGGRVEAGAGVGEGPNDAEGVGDGA